MSDTLTPKNDGQFTKADVGFITYYLNNNTSSGQYIFTTLPEAMNATDARAWIAETYPDATFCYQLETPIHHPLSPQIIRTLKGTNNIWSDANGTLEATYWR